jgi:hypothetical protein
MPAQKTKCQGVPAPGGLRAGAPPAHPPGSACCAQQAPAAQNGHGAPAAAQAAGGEGRKHTDQSVWRGRRAARNGQEHGAG